MMKSIKYRQVKLNYQWISSRGYTLSCPPRKTPGVCKPICEIRHIVPPADCKPRPIPPNPCVPRFHHGKPKTYRLLTFLALPLIILQAIHAFGHEHPPKGECRDYEYMRIRSKRFPWGDGTKSLFHNDHTNHLPGECVVPLPECD